MIVSEIAQELVRELEVVAEKSVDWQDEDLCRARHTLLVYIAQLETYKRLWLKLRDVAKALREGTMIASVMVQGLVGRVVDGARTAEDNFQDPELELELERGIHSLLVYIAQLETYQRLWLELHDVAKALREE